jgi:hypothetical protein
MQHAIRRRAGGAAAAALVATLLWSVQGLADTLATRLDDAAFWALIEGASEPDGAFQSENFLSNETGFQAVIPPLLQSTRRDGVYLGVGPEQNFTYIVAIRPKIAFIIDIRRQNLLEHLVYKAVFEMSTTRADFLSRLFCRKRPAGLTDRSTADELFGAYGTAPPDRQAFTKNLRGIKDLLEKTHKFGLTREDESIIGRIYTAFHAFGPDINYNSGAGSGGGMPNYVELMTATDLQGEQRSYLASEENYRVIRDLERRNLVVPITGDFGGRTAIRAVGQYLKDHGATVTAFYLSNVERYLFQGSGVNHNGGWTSFYNNVAALPLDSASTFIRSVSGGVPGAGGGMRLPNVLASIQDTLAAVKDGRIRTYDDVFLLSK